MDDGGDGAAFGGEFEGAVVEARDPRESLGELPLLAEGGAEVLMSRAEDRDLGGEPLQVLDALTDAGYAGSARR